LVVYQTDNYQIRTTRSVQPAPFCRLP
jgi:hypothetical protein